MGQLKIALIQLLQAEEAAENRRRAAELIAEAAQQAELVLLPEMWALPYQMEILRGAAEEPDAVDGTVRWLREQAGRHGIWLQGGTVPLAAPGGRILNAATLCSPDGDLFFTYNKNHLYDVDLPGMQVTESAAVVPGEHCRVAETPWGSTGVAVCYDLRFPELFRALAQQGAQLVCVPAVFNRVSGPPHWELLVRARALDTQLFVAACAPADNPRFAYRPYAHSLVVDPWGEVIARADDGETVLHATLDFERVQEVRRRLPVANHLRRDLYPVAGGCGSFTGPAAGSTCLPGSG